MFLQWAEFERIVEEVRGLSTLINNHEFCIRNDGLCIINDSFWIINDGMCFKHDVIFIQTAGTLACTVIAEGFESTAKAQGWMDGWAETIASRRNSSRKKGFALHVPGNILSRTLSHSCLHAKPKPPAPAITAVILL